MSKAVIFFAPGLEECEGLLCVDILRRAGVEVTIAAVGGEKIVKSARRISVVADALAEELDYTVFDACILPGGIPGVPNLKADATVRRVCRDFAAEGKVVAAICAAPTALAAFGVLNGKKATVYPGMDADLTAAGASYTGLPLTIDGSIVTGEALGAAIPFALALARILTAANQLNRRGYEVTVFEKYELPGGLLRFGIPNFKLGKNIIDRRIRLMEQEGIVFKVNTMVGNEVSAKEIASTFDAVCIAIGSEVPRDLPIEGRNLKGVHFALELLSQQNRIQIGRAHV